MFLDLQAFEKLLAAKEPTRALRMAILANNFPAAQRAVDAGANVNYKIRCGGTALFFCKTIKMLKLLIEYGIYINVKNDYGYIVTETTPYKKIAKYVNSLYKNNAEKTNKKGGK